MIEEALFIGSTHLGKSSSLDRWECPNCRRNKSVECRFNLSSKKRGTVWKCRFCKRNLYLLVSIPKNSLTKNWEKFKRGIQK